jgi:hypothetical protein
MRQLLQYGIKLGEAQSSDMSPETLLREAEVCTIWFAVFSIADLGISLSSATGSRAQVDPALIARICRHPGFLFSFFHHTVYLTLVCRYVSLASMHAVHTQTLFAFIIHSLTSLTHIMFPALCFVKTCGACAKLAHFE